jgi:hypothetical protein
MNPFQGSTESAGSLAGKNEELTGLPGLRTWRGVYLLVFGCFVLWVALLLALTMGYQ